MKIGLSSYSLAQAINAGEMTILDAIQWTADNGGEHIEIVPMGFDLKKDPELVEAVRQKTAEVGIDISNYAIGANFITANEGEWEEEVERVKKHVDIAHQLGVDRMRHDIAWRPAGEASIAQFEADLPRLVQACQQIADYAAPYGITTSIENHGFYIQASDRVQRIINEVNRDNFRTTMDVGNFMCVDENAVAGVKNNLPYASMIHLKDFYYRPGTNYPGEGWLQTTAGNYLRGAIVGQGDLDMGRIVNIIKASGYDGYLSIEFEGWGDCRVGSKVGMANAKRLWEEA